MTKADLVDALQERLPVYAKKELASVVDDVFDEIKKALVSTGELKVSGFGNFNVRRKNERTGRNPKTGGEITITARKVVTFKPSQKLVARMNDHR